jgi:hypothetical protein
MSLDGYYTGPANNVMVLPMDGAFDAYNAEQLRAADTLWNDLLAHDLVDELHLMIGAVVIGGGTPIFEGKPAASLRPIDIREWDDSDNVLVRYEVRHEKVL